VLEGLPVSGQAKLEAVSARREDGGRDEEGGGAVLAIPGLGPCGTIVQASTLYGSRRKESATSR
jgi:hypothetical protein